MKKIYTTIISLITAILASATPIDSAQTLYNEGKFREALPIFKELLKESPKDANLNFLTGVSYFKLDSISNAKQLLSAANDNGKADAAKYLSIIALNEYDFDNAGNYLSTYKNALQKNNDSISSDIATLSLQIMNAKNMLGRVENIQIIDSINVDSATFFKFYRLSKDIGTLNATSILPNNFSATTPTVVFQPESQTQMIWAMTDSLGISNLVSSSMLSDGTWEHPHKLSDVLNDGGNANYPFIMPDGYTMYFANDGANSIGGYDLYITRKDEDGFLNPQNMGMPYNSPFNDYMLVIDEITGIGWWASDRNHINGKVTIYMYIPNATRINYPTDTKNLVNLAKINSIKDTWIANNNYSNILAQFDDLTTGSVAIEQYEFTLSLPNGKIYTSINDFKNSEAAIAMNEYLNAVAEIEQKQSELNELRKKYSTGDKSVNDRILLLEKQILNEKVQLVRLRNIAISLEIK